MYRKGSQGSRRSRLLRSLFIIHVMKGQSCGYAAINLVREYFLRHWERIFCCLVSYYIWYIEETQKWIYWRANLFFDFIFALQYGKCLIESERDWGEGIMAYCDSFDFLKRHNRITIVQINSIEKWFAFCWW